MPAPEQVFDNDGKTSKSPQSENPPLPIRTKESPAPPWRRKRREEFQGDVAVADLRSRLALKPERVPEPPLSAAPTRVVRMARLAMAATAVGVASAYLWQFKMPTSMAQLTSGPADAVLTPVPAATVAASNLAFDTPAEARPAIGFAAADTHAEARPAPAGAATSIDAPQQSAALQAQTASPAAALRPPAATEDAPLIAAKMKIGVELVTYGEVVAARLMFQRAAEAGDGAGAFALAETYDPLVLEEWRLREKITPNVALARTWYERARDLGSLEARDRISRLALLPQ